MLVALRFAVVLMVAVAMLGGSAQCSQDHWYVFLTADNGSGMNGGPDLFLGVDPAASEGLDSADREAAYWIDISATTRWAVSRIPGSNVTYRYNIYSPSGSMMSTRAWQVWIGGLPKASNDPMRVHVWTSAYDTVTPPSALGGNLVGYRLIMEDNKGVTGAPANGAVWELPVTATSASYYLQMPMIRLSAGTHDAMISEGYRLRFEQYLLPQQQVVPEPGGLSVLAVAMIGLSSSVVLRRRR